MKIVTPAIDKYIYSLLPKRDPILAEMEAHAKRHHVPIVGPAVGRLLALLAQMSGAKRIFEMGSAIGYSTLWLARAAGPGAEVFYTDGNPENAKRAEAAFKRAGVADRIHVQVGNALDLLQKQSGEFDLIFNDVDKHYYSEVFRIAVPRVRSGGLFITDNSLWSGRILKKTKNADTRGVQKFNKLVYDSKVLYPVIVPLRDGVMVCRKS
jgi:caffeoyl-CoA O-methyltransferase